MISRIKRGRAKAENERISLGETLTRAEALVTAAEISALAAKWNTLTEKQKITQLMGVVTRLIIRALD